MFFKRKRDEEREVLAKLDAISRAVEGVCDRELPALKKTVDELSTQEMPALSKTVEELRTQAGRHDMAIEDLLDEWADKDAARREAKMTLQRYKEREEGLVEPLELYQEQFWSIKKFLASKDEALAVQMAAFEERVKPGRQLCQISCIEEAAQAVDFRIHEVVEVLETRERELDGKIAEVYSPGSLYEGAVRKKARVAAWKYIQ
ncbi:MAG: hypothetical protein LIP11_11735 [Clostridiales bacterium]|nr:hypothetical protein [Clostridiales bacterium]